MDKIKEIKKILKYPEKIGPLALCFVTNTLGAVYGDDNITDLVDWAKPNQIDTVHLFLTTGFGYLLHPEKRRKLITFRRIKANCKYFEWDFAEYCSHPDNTEKCSGKNCPVWRKLKNA